MASLQFAINKIQWAYGAGSSALSTPFQESPVIQMCQDPFDMIFFVLP